MFSCCALFNTDDNEMDDMEHLKALEVSDVESITMIALASGIAHFPSESKERAKLPSVVHPNDGMRSLFPLPRPQNQIVMDLPRMLRN